jgi:hypothetical protein
MISCGSDWMPARFMMLPIIPMISAPRTVLIGSPVPPNSEVPPTTVAAIESSS